MSKALRKQFSIKQKAMAPLIAELKNKASLNFNIMDSILNLNFEQQKFYFSYSIKNMIIICFPGQFFFKLQYPL